MKIVLVTVSMFLLFAMGCSGPTESEEAATVDEATIEGAAEAVESEAESAIDEVLSEGSKGAKYEALKKQFFGKEK